MFERMEISESINEGVVEPSYKKPTRTEPNRYNHSMHDRREASLSWTFTEKCAITGKCRKIHVDILIGRSKTCLIHVPGHSSD